MLRCVRVIPALSKSYSAATIVQRRLFSTRPGPLTKNQIEQFNKEGVLFVRRMFSQPEIDRLMAVAKADKVLEAKSHGREDSEGRVSRMTLWNHPGDDIYSLFSRSRRVVDSMEQLLNDEVYHYHTKLMLKEPFVGGRWNWHQDYGYWYNNGCLRPDLASCMVALDRATKANGCLEVLVGSHLLGRLNHVVTGGQAGADMERVEQARKVLPHIYCEMEAGDALFFHSNTLHTSAPNQSPNPRWSLIMCYNAKSNNPFLEHHHPFYTPLAKVDDSDILTAPARGFAEVPNDSFLDVKKDVSAAPEVLAKHQGFAGAQGGSGKVVATPDMPARDVPRPLTSGLAQ